jgi:hypothetical protein
MPRRAAVDQEKWRPVDHAGDRWCRDRRLPRDDLRGRGTDSQAREACDGWSIRAMTHEQASAEDVKAEHEREEEG